VELGRGLARSGAVVVIVAAARGDESGDDGEY
jgi:hypothetical protein